MLFKEQSILIISKMETDPHKKKTRLMIIGSVILLFIFIIVRIISTSTGDGLGLGVYEGPKFDSVKLPEDNNKISEFEEEARREQEKKYKPEESEDAVFVNFKKAYKKTSGESAEENENRIDSKKTVQSKSVSSPEKNNYTPILYAKKEKVIEEEVPQKIGKTKEVVKKEEVESEEEENDNPFGTIKTGKTKATSSTKKAKDMVRAEVYGDQSVTNGGGVVFRNTDEIIIGGITVPKNSILYGKANYSGDRVLITVSRAKTQSGDEVIDLTCYDNDYIEGVYFKAPRDEAVDKTKDDASEDIGEQLKNSKLVVRGVKTVGKAVKNTTEAIKKDRKLSVEDGYIVYLKINTKKK